MDQERRLRSRSYLSLSWTKNDWAAGMSTSRIGSMNYQSLRWDGKPNGDGKEKSIHIMILVHLLDMISMMVILLLYQYQT